MLLCGDFSLFSIFFFLFSFLRSYKKRKNAIKRISYFFPLRRFLSTFFIFVCLFAFLCFFVRLVFFGAFCAFWCFLVRAKSFCKIITIILIITIMIIIIIILIITIMIIIIIIIINKEFKTVLMISFILLLTIAHTKLKTLTL